MIWAKESLEKRFGVLPCPVEDDHRVAQLADLAG